MSRWIKGKLSGENPDSFCKNCAQHAKNDFDGGLADICANEHSPMTTKDVARSMSELAAQLSWADIPEQPNEFALFFADADAIIPAKTIDPMPVSEWEVRAIARIKAISDRIKTYGLIEE